MPPTLELARQRVLAPPAPPMPPAPTAPPRPVPVPDVRIDSRAAGIALAIVISWLAAGALVVGFAWVASTLEPRDQLPAGSMPYALAWSGASLAALVTSVASLFLPARQPALLGAAALVTLVMAVAVAIRV